MTREPLKLETLRPADTPEYMTPAWLGCIAFALGEPELLQAFRDETGNQWRPGRPGIEQMIDAATGAERAFVEAFVAWVNVNVWGPIAGPEE